MNGYGRAVACVAVAVVLGRGAERACGDVTPQQRVMAKRAAEADAYRKMAELLMGLEFAGETTVRQFVTTSDRMRSEVNAFIRSIRIDPDSVRFYEDGTCEVTAETTVEEVTKTLKRVCDKYYDGKKWQSEDFEELRRRTKRKVFRVLGNGAASEETLMPDPGTLEYIRDPYGESLNLPSIWKRYPGRERLNAKRVAEMDAYGKLVARVFGVLVKSRTLTDNALMKEDEIKIVLRNYLRGARTGVVCYQPNGLVQVHMSMTLDQIVKTLKKTYDEVYEGGKWTTESSKEIRKTVDRKTITVIGVGALDVNAQQRPATAPASEGGAARRRHIESEEIIEQTTVIVLD